MSKRSNAATQQQPNQDTQRLGCTLDAQTHLLINTMAAFRGVPTAQIVTEGIWALMDQHQNREKESFLGVVRAKFGRICRPFTKVQGDSSGAGELVPESGLESRTNRITNMQSRFVNAVDEAVADFGK